MTHVYRIRGTTEIFLRDASGRVKPLWAENALGRLARRRLGVDLQGNRLFGHWAHSLTRPNTITNVGHAAGNGRISNQGSYNAMVNIALGTGTQGSPSTATAPTGLAMPDFGWRYDDADIAALATFVRSNWGNDAPAVAASQVAQLRR